MKKILSFVIALVIIVTAIQPLFTFAGSGDGDGEIWDQFFTTSEGATVTDCTVTSGSSITFKATLPSADSYVQLNQKLTDLFTGAKFTVGTNSSAETCYLQLTADATAATDIVPVNEYAGENPGTVGMTWLIYKSGNYVVFGRGVNPNGLGAKLTTWARFSGDTRAYDITFGKLDDGKVAVSAPKFNAENGFDDYAPSNKTAEEVGLTDGGYFRLRNRDGGPHTFTVTVYSKDISGAYKDGNFILSDLDSKLNSSSVAYADGKATYTYNVTLATKDSYVQLDKKLSDLFAGAKFTVGTTSSAETCYLQLTADATAKTDIVPVNEYAGENPGTVGMTWLIYKSGNYVVFGRGVNPNGLGAKLTTWARFSGDTRAYDITFGKLDDGKVAVSAPKFNAENGFDDYAPSNKTAEEVGLTDGGYFRLRNRDTAASTFTVSVTTADTEARPITVTGGTASVETATYGTSVTLTPEVSKGYKFNGWKVVSGNVEIVDNAFVMGSEPVEIEAIVEETVYVDGDYIFSDPNSKLDSSSVKREDGKVTYTATVTLKGSNGYVQLNQKLTDLFNGAKFTIGTADAENAYLQLTADATAETDIVPVAENTTDPGTDGMTWLILKNGNFVLLGRGANTNGTGSRLSTYDRFNSTTGVENITFSKVDGKVAVSAPEFTTSNIQCGFTDYAPSTKTAEEVGLTNGGYFRLRNRDDAERTFTITITTEDTTKLNPITVTGGTASVETAVKGTYVTLTPDAAPAGYVFAGWKVVSGGVTVEKNAFTMGNESVEIEAIYKESVYTDGDYILSDPDSKIESSSVTRENGKILYTATVELATKDSYVQLNKNLINLFNGAKFTVGTNSSAESVYLQLTADATGKTDIVPVAENTTDPGTDGMTWLILKNGNFVLLGRGANTNGTGSRLSTYGRFNSTTGVENITFSKVDGKVAVSAPEFTTSNIQCGFTDYAPSTKSAEEVGLTNGGYFRLRNRDNAKHTFTFAIEIPDSDTRAITVTGGTASVESAAYGDTVTLTPDEAPAGYKFAGWKVVSGGVEVVNNEFTMGSEPVEIEAKYSYTDGNYILSDQDSKIIDSKVTYANGKASYTATVSLSGKDSYVQFSKKISDLLTGASFTVGTTTAAESAYLQLTADANALTDIVPVAENSTDPGTNGMTWLIYKSGNFVVFGRGANTAGLGSRLSTYGRFSGDGVANIKFGKVDGDKVAVTADKFTTSGYDCGFDDYAPSTKTAEEVGLTDGGYFRLRNREDEEHIFTFTVTTEDSAYTDGDYILSDEGSKVEDSKVTTKGSKVTYTTTVNLSGNGGYIQLNKKLATLVKGGAAISIKIGNNKAEDYNNANVQAQLTTDEIAETDIAPVDERTVDPGNKGMTWLFYGSGDKVWSGRGSSTAGGGLYAGNNDNVVDNGGINFKFNLEEDGKVSYRSTDANGFTGTLPSTKTLEDIGGTDGVYFRLRNNSTSSVKYTLTIVVSDDFDEPSEPGDDNDNPDDEPSEPGDGKPYDGIFKDYLYVSGNGDVDEVETSFVDGEAFIKVTLPANGYVQFKQKLTDLFNGAKFTVASESAESCYLQLTDDATAQTDIVPQPENLTDPGTDGMTWLILKDGNFVVLGRGANTAGTGSRLSTYGRFTGAGVANMTFGKVDGDKVAVSAPEFITSEIPCGFTDYAASTRTAEEVGLTDGGYFRLRNRDNAKCTYTITILSDDIKGMPVPEKENSYNGKFKDYLYVSENGKVNESETKIISGKATLKVTVAPGGYFQYLQNIGDLIGGNATINIKLGKHEAEDYKTANFHVQLTTDAKGTSNIAPVNEEVRKLNNKAVSFYMLTSKASGHMFIGSGSNDAGATTYTWQNRIFADYNDVADGITLKFPKSEDGYMQATNPRQDLINAGVAVPYTSKQTVSDIGAEDGVYVRIRNNKTEAVTFTLVINSNDVYPLISPAYKEGKWIFSSEDTTNVSQESSVEKGIYTEKLTAIVAPNGYVQFDKKLKYLIGNSKSTITIKVGEGTIEDYDNARIQVQLTADQKAERDIIPVNENEFDPGVKGMTWLFYGQSGKMWTGRGSTTAYGGFYGTTNLMSTMHGGLNIVFNNDAGKVSYDTSVGGLKVSGNLPSTKTLEEIGGTDGVYVRLRNAAEESVKYTITIKYTAGIIEGKPVTQKGWTVKGETENGVQIVDELDEVLPGFRAWNLTIPENTYAQYNTKITDLKDAAFRFDTGEYSKVGYSTSFAFVTDPDAPWDPKTPDGNIRKFTIFIRPTSDPENTHIALATGTVVPGKSNANPTLRTLLTAVTHEGQGGFSLSFVKENGHWYLSVSGIVLRDAGVLDEYLCMDEFVKNGAYFRIYANANGEKYMYPQVSISSKVVPPIGSDEEDLNLTEEERLLKEFLDYFTDNIDGLRRADMDIVNKVAEMWNALSYLNQSNVEAYFIDDDEVYYLIQAIKAYASFEPTPDKVEWITTYTTVYTTTTITTTIPGSSNTDSSTDSYFDSNNSSDSYFDSNNSFESGTDSNTTDSTLEDNNETPKRKKKIIKKKKKGNNNFPMVAVIVVSTVVVLAAAGGVTFFVIRKKRKNIIK